MSLFSRGRIPLPLANRIPLQIKYILMGFKVLVQPYLLFLSQWPRTIPPLLAPSGFQLTPFLKSSTLHTCFPQPAPCCTCHPGPSQRGVLSQVLGGTSCHSHPFFLPPSTCVTGANSSESAASQSALPFSATLLRIGISPSVHSSEFYFWWLILPLEDLRWVSATYP